MEAAPWVVALLCYVLLPDHRQLGAQIIGMVLFALSFDLLLGYAGIVTLGHAAYFGTRRLCRRAAGRRGLGRSRCRAWLWRWPPLRCWGSPPGR